MRADAGASVQAYLKAKDKKVKVENPPADLPADLPADPLPVVKARHPKSKPKAGSSSKKSTESWKLGNHNKPWSPLHVEQVFEVGRTHVSGTGSQHFAILARKLKRKVGSCYDLFLDREKSKWKPIWAAMARAKKPKRAQPSTMPQQMPGMMQQQMPGMMQQQQQYQPDMFMQQQIQQQVQAAMIQQQMQQQIQQRMQQHM